MNSIDDGANQKAFPEDARYGAFTRGKKYLCKNLGVKEGGENYLPWFLLGQVGAPLAMVF